MKMNTVVIRNGSNYTVMHLPSTNPGRKHIAGKDITAKMQRQYEHVLESLRASRTFGRDDKKRKSVAAATVRKLAHNPLEPYDREYEWDGWTEPAPSSVRRRRKKRNPIA